MHETQLENNLDIQVNTSNYPIYIPIIQYIRIDSSPFYIDQIEYDWEKIATDSLQREKMFDLMIGTIKVFIDRPLVDFVFVIDDGMKMNRKHNMVDRSYFDVLNQFISQCYYNLMRPEDRLHVCMEDRDCKKIIPLQTKQTIQKFENMNQKTITNQRIPKRIRVFESAVSVMRKLEQDAKQNNENKRHINMIVVVYDMSDSSDEKGKRMFTKKLNDHTLSNFHLKIISITQSNHENIFCKRMESIKAQSNSRICVENTKGNIIKFRRSLICNSIYISRIRKNKQIGFF